jgi:hypothetical protein
VDDQAMPATDGCGARRTLLAAIPNLIGLIRLALSSYEC